MIIRRYPLIIVALAAAAVTAAASFTFLLLGASADPTDRRVIETFDSVASADANTEFAVREPGYLPPGFRHVSTVLSQHMDGRNGAGTFVETTWTSDEKWLSLQQAPTPAFRLGNSKPSELAGLPVDLAIHEPREGRPFGIYSVGWVEGDHGFILTLPFDLEELDEVEEMVSRIVNSMR